jgi:hypothetical protein
MSPLSSVLATFTLLVTIKLTFDVAMVDEGPDNAAGILALGSVLSAYLATCYGW